MKSLRALRKSDFIAGAVILTLFLLPLFLDAPVASLRLAIGDNYLLSASAFVVLMFVATVVAPVTVPLAVPAAAPFLGPWQTALLAVFGWSLGGIVAFFIARHFGRTIVVSLVGEDRIAAFEKRIPERNLFFWMLFLRVVIPVDVLSYGLGLISKVKFVPYVVSMVLGITPFAFIGAYAGEALLMKEYGRVVGFIALGTILFLVIAALARRYT